MKSILVRLSFLSAFLFCVAFLAPGIAWAQDTKPLPESPPPESKPEPPPSPPAEAPRNDPPPSPLAETPRNDPPPSPPAESPRSSSPPAEAPRSDPAPNNGGSRNNDGGSSRSNNDNRRNDNDRRAGEDGGRVRGTMSGDGSGNRRDRVIETDAGEVVAPGRTGAGNSTAGNPGGGNAGGGRNAGGNRGGDAGNRRDRDGRHRGGDGDRDRWRDRHRDGRGHRHYRGDECYQAPTYDDTVSYSAASYPDYDQDDSLSAYDRGYNDGLYTGANDGRRGQTYDPERSHFYKSGSGGYRSSKGSRAVYEMAYRDGFLRGYREGYQNWQKYFVGGVFRRY